MRQGETFTVQTCSLLSVYLIKQKLFERLNFHCASYFEYFGNKMLLHLSFAVDRGTIGRN
jgi:hypothetical protein